MLVDRERSDKMRVFTGMYYLLCVHLDEVQYFDPSIRLHTHNIRLRLFGMLHALEYSGSYVASLLHNPNNSGDELTGLSLGTSGFRFTFFVHLC